MVNPEHIELLLRGVDAWNEWRRKEPYITPRLGGAEVYSRFKESGKLGLDGRIMLAAANLSRACLKYADLRLANLDGANLDHADLRNATLENAWLRGAYLNSAQLEGANLSYANLSDAKLERVSIDRAALRSARLIGANLHYVKLWKADLYPEDMSAKPHPEGQTPVETLETITGLLDEIRRLKELYKSQCQEIRFYFRGECSTEWELRPSVMRDDSKKFESEMLLDLISRRPAEFNGMNSSLAEWVLAQHHGLKTRFLDITQNPLVALFSSCGGIEGKGNKWEEKPGRFHIFAVPRSLVKPFNSNTISIIANFAKLSQYEQDLLLGKPGETNHSFDQASYSEPLYPEAMRRLYQLIRQEKPHFEPRLAPKVFYQVFVVEPQQSNERIRAQSGAFLASAFHERFEQDEVQQSVKGVPVYAHYRLTVPGKNKAAIMEDLRLFNITQGTMFPGLDSSIKEITNRYGPQK